jgi:hypothetical protein
MEVLNIPMTASSPLVRFEPESCTLRIEGESYPENSFEFYEPILTWLKDALASLDSLCLDIDVSYMNSSSTKCMLDLLDTMEEAAAQGKRLSVVWRYDPENPRALDLAEEFKEEVSFEFRILPQERTP